MTHAEPVKPAATPFPSEPSAFFPRDAHIARARSLLDRAMADWARAEHWTHGGGSEPLYRPEIRWEMVRAARQLLGE